MLDGHLNICKECVKARVREHRRLNEHVREYDRKRGKRPERIKKNVERTREWRRKNPKQASAHRKVAYAVSAGKIKRTACAFCGCAGAEAHHHDYEKPLDITWVCAKCHRRLHALFPDHVKGKKAA
jgi:ribosomal protein S27AE